MSTFGLYLHIPFCVKKCNYCDFLSFPAKEALKDEYVKALAMEMRLWKDKVSNDVVDTILSVEERHLCLRRGSLMFYRMNGKIISFI